MGDDAQPAVEPTADRTPRHRSRVRARKDRPPPDPDDDATSGADLVDDPSGPDGSTGVESMDSDDAEPAVGNAVLPIPHAVIMPTQMLPVAASTVEDDEH